MANDGATTVALLDAILGPTEQREKAKADRQALHDSLIEWHTDRCKGRHGVVRNVTLADRGKVVDMLDYFFGGNIYRQTVSRGVCNLEFASTSKKPWGYCGTSVLFEDWRIEDEESRAATNRFSVGDRVSFVHKGTTYTGLISATGYYVQAVVIVEGSGKWSINGKNLRRA